MTAQDVHAQHPRVPDRAAGRPVLGRTASGTGTPARRAPGS
ncbi:hypothetical protein [Kocuria sp. KH4]